MTKKIVGSAIAVLAMLPVAAFASTTQNFLTLDGGTTATIAAGDSVDGKLQFTNTGNSTVQSVWVEIPGSGFPGACMNVEPNQNSTGVHTSIFAVDTSGATEGTWDVKVTTFGVPSNQTGANNNCDSTIGNSNVHTFNNVLTLTAEQTEGSNANNTGGNSSGSGTSSGDSVIEQLQKQLADLKALFSSLVSTVAAMAPDAVCAQLPMGNTSALQSFLMSPVGGQAAAFNSAGVYAPTGFYGPITTGAVAAFKAQHKCN